MGVFDKLSGSEAASLTSKSALALSAMTVIGADGVIEDEELEGLQRIVRGDEKAFRDAYAVYKARTIEECLHLVASVLNDDQKAATIANLLDIAMADGVLAGAEEALLQAYVSEFGLSDDDLKMIIDVIALKNNFSIFE